MKKRDEQGNRLFIGDTGIYLKLATERNNRQIFTFRDGNIVKYVEKNGVMKAGGGMVGFNYHALKYLLENKRLKKKPIHVKMGNKYYKVTAQEILDLKNFLHFKSEGFELQCFYPVKDLVSA